jgi:hypothetical protein
MASSSDEAAVAECYRVGYFLISIETKRSHDKFSFEYSKPGVTVCSLARLPA